MKAILFLSISILMYVFSAGDGSGFEVGDAAVDFKLKNVDGKYISLSDYPDANGFIIAFTCNTCPYAKFYEQRIIDLHNKYAPLGYPVIAVNPNDPVKQPGDSFEEMKKLAKKKNYPFPYLMDETQETTKAYGATNTPHMYVLQKQSGQYIVKYIGAIDNNPKEPENVSKAYLEDAIDALLKGDEVPEKKTKAIGCSIKWKSA